MPGPVDVTGRRDANGLSFVPMQPGCDVTGFDCDSHEQNIYLWERATRDQQALISSTTLVYVDRSLAAYLTLCMDSLKLEEAQPEDIPYDSLPALKLGQMGVDAEYQGRGLGGVLISYAIAKAQQIGREVGCRYVTLDARNDDLVSYYRSYGFVTNELAEPSDQTSMRFDIRERDGLPGSRRLP